MDKNRIKILIFAAILYREPKKQRKMRILLIGEYSNVHHTLCEALRRAGHEVLLISDGDGWKNYPRDIDLRRHCSGMWGSLRYLARLATLLPRMRGYDVVQIVNPVFLDVKVRWNRWTYDYLKRHNRLVSVGCFGDDYYVIRGMMNAALFDYSDFQISGRAIDHETNRRRYHAWVESPKAALTQYVVDRADCLMACLYEYWWVYKQAGMGDKLYYMPLPVGLKSADGTPVSASSSAGKTFGRDVTDGDGKVRILLASQRQRGQMKGTDKIEPLLERLAADYPDRIELQRIVSVPFAEYQRFVALADVVVDQLYSYTPAMAALESLSQGKVVISGFETAYARFLNEQEAGVLPQDTGIVNLRPDDDDRNYQLLIRELTDIDRVRQLQAAARVFVLRYHEADTVAHRYLEAWQSLSTLPSASEGETVEGSSSSNRPSQR